MIDRLFEQRSWDLAVLARAVHYKNLTAAAQHVGLSQPQLSRIVQRLEGVFKLELLDRSQRRHSGWTEKAKQLAQIYSKNLHDFEAEINILLSGSIQRELRVGTLEGMVDTVIPFLHSLFDQAELRLISLEVHDSNVLESLFLQDEFDLVFSSHIPGRRKYRNLRELGFQSLDKIKRRGSWQILSSSEHESRSSRRKKTDTKIFVSNSLSARRIWLDEYGGEATLPSEVRKTELKSAICEPVLLIGNDALPSSIWQYVTDYKF